MSDDHLIMLTPEQFKALDNLPDDAPDLRALLAVRRPIEAIPVEGHQTRAEEFAQGVVESMTKWDFVELPDELRRDLVDWSERFTRWMDEQA